MARGWIDTVVEATSWESHALIQSLLLLAAIPDVPEMHDWIKLTRWKLRDVE